MEKRIDIQKFMRRMMLKEWEEDAKNRITQNHLKLTYNSTDPEQKIIDFDEWLEPQNIWEDE